MRIAAEIGTALLGIAMLLISVWSIVSGLYAILFNMKPHYERWLASWSKSDTAPNDGITWGLAYFEMGGRIFMGIIGLGMAWACLFVLWSGKLAEAFPAP